MTTREKKKESPSDLTKLASRMDNLEVLTGKLANAVTTLTERLQEPGKLPMAVSPDARIAAMKQAVLGGEAVSRRKSIDLSHPGAEQNGFKPDDIVRLAEDSPKYGVYQLNDRGEPVKQIHEYRCQACPTTEEYESGPNKKVCPKCGNTMLKAPTGRYEPGIPALGVVVNFMYKARKGGRKYKVHFEKFGHEGLMETEMILC